MLKISISLRNFDSHRRNCPITPSYNTAQIIYLKRFQELLIKTLKRGTKTDLCWFKRDLTRGLFLLPRWKKIHSFLVLHPHSTPRKLYLRLATKCMHACMHAFMHACVKDIAIFVRNMSFGSSGEAKVSRSRSSCCSCLSICLRLFSRFSADTETHSRTSRPKWHLHLVKSTQKKHPRFKKIQQNRHKKTT